MADTYDNTNRITIFKQTDKKSEKAPDFTGTLYIGDDIIKGLKNSDDGLVRVALWKQTSKGGANYLNGSIQLPQEQSGGQVKKSSKKEETFDDEDDDF